MPVWRALFVVRYRRSCFIPRTGVAGDAISIFWRALGPIGWRPCFAHYDDSKAASSCRCQPSELLDVVPLTQSTCTKTQDLRIFVKRVDAALVSCRRRGLRWEKAKPIPIQARCGRCASCGDNVDTGRRGCHKPLGNAGGSDGPSLDGWKFEHGVEPRA